MRRFDETWHPLLEWTMGQTPSERMAALILDEEGFESIDPLIRWAARTAAPMP